MVCKNEQNICVIAHNFDRWVTILSLLYHVVGHYYICLFFKCPNTNNKWMWIRSSYDQSFYPLVLAWNTTDLRTSWWLVACLQLHLGWHSVLAKDTHTSATGLQPFASAVHTVFSDAALLVYVKHHMNNWTSDIFHSLVWCKPVPVLVWGPSYRVRPRRGSVRWLAFLLRLFARWRWLSSLLQLLLLHLQERSG